MEDSSHHASETTMDQTQPVLETSTSQLTTTAGARNLAVLQDIEKLYPSNKITAKRRFEGINKKFRDLFSGTMSHLVRVPALLKVPHEQIALDAFPYGLLTMEQDIVVAVGRVPNSDKLRVASHEKSKFPMVVES